MGIKRQSPPGIQPRAPFSTAAGSPEAPLPHPGRPFWKWFTLIVACAFALRAANALFVLQPENPQFNPNVFPDSDMWTNQNQALEMVANHGFPKNYFRHAPLYVCLIAAVYLVFPGKFVLIYAVQVAAGSLLCGLLYWIGRRVWSETEGRIAGLAAACYAPLMFYETMFLSDSLAIALATAFVAVALVYQDAQRRPLLLACAMGAVLGLTTLQRSNLALMGVALAPWMLIVPRQFPLRTRFLSVVLVAAISIATTIPFSIHNTRKLGHFAFSQGQTKEVIGQSIGTESPGYFHYPYGTPNNPRLPFFSLANARLLARKTIFFFSWFEFPDLYNYYIIGHFSPLIRYNPLTFRILGPLALLGMGLGLTGRLGPRRGLSLLYAAALALFAGVVLFFVAGRYRAASVPLYLLFAARALTWLVQEAKRVHASRAANLFIPSVLFLLCVLFVLCNSLNTSRFHSMWYCDSMPHNKLMDQVARALAADDLAMAERAAARVLWIRDADYQRDGHLALAEVARRQGDSVSRKAHLKIARQIEEIRDKEPVLDYFGNRYFPPTDRFAPTDPLAVAKTPAHFLGATALKGGARKAGGGTKDP